ncbi:LCP family protein [Actinomadura hibisca]|uniref:LCP family protein n=1 Tax=Actinomadura hibisca TaxID=68565 RepID=UPI0008296BE7|nr:LCP family protein [Actinomadura hibisca]
MDDLKAIRDLGDDLGHEPPASLVRQRQRLVDAAGGRAPRRRPSGWLLIGVVTAVTAALILVPTVLLRGGGEPGGKKDLNAATAPAKPINVLIIGSDARGGAVREARSDTLVLAHLPADRKRPRLLSLPRDLMVDLPACGRFPARRGQLNLAFTLGGAACTEAAVEKLSGVRVDRTVTIGFAGFKTMVNALGSVQISVPRSVNDPKAGLRLAAGRHRVNGSVALAYVRARHGLGDGSDLDRVKRQQRFMASLAREAKAMRLKSPVRFAAFLKATAGAVEIRPSMDFTTVKRLAETAETDTAVYGTVPVRPDRRDFNRLELAPSAPSVFAQFK